MNLLSTMIGVAIVAILSMVAVPDWIHGERNATLSSAADELASARLTLQRSAAEDTGATLAINGSVITVTGNGGGADWSGRLPDDATCTINGATLGCLALNGEEIPVTSPGCSTTPPIAPWQGATPSPGAATPIVWSAHLDGQTETLP
ncbi:MAG: hypothetical protein M0003_10660 [Acidithiobacillus sp.]|nr:hypothetical protein [Acidithiobacillus sp.]